jgi:uncharacterized peroxidase-related enzyme
MDLRSEVGDSALAWQIASDYTQAKLAPEVRAALDYAVKLTLTPGKMGPDDVQRLRDAGWDDRGIHDIAQVAAYFNYINRVADGLGVDLEPGMPPHPPK